MKDKIWASWRLSWSQGLKEICTTPPGSELGRPLPCNTENPLQHCSAPPGCTEGRAVVLPLALEGTQGKDKLQCLCFFIKSIVVLPWPILRQRDKGVQLLGCVGAVTEQSRIQTHQLATVCLCMGWKRAVWGCGESCGACCRTLSHPL